jgi:periplasmic protein TonB
LLSPFVPSRRAERSIRTSPRRAAARSIGLSLGLHLGALAVFAGPMLYETTPRRAPIAFAVEASLLQHDAPPARPDPCPPPSVEIEPVTEDPVESPILDEAEPGEAPATLPEPRTVVVERTPPRQLADCAAAARLPVRRPPPAPPIEPTTPTTPEPTPPAPASLAPAEARPEVPVPIPGQNPAPDYPDSARRRRIEGTVLVLIEVTGDGCAADCVVAQSSGCLALDQAALAAARRWQFQHGPGRVEVPFVFQLLRAS